MSKAAKAKGTLDAARKKSLAKAQTADVLGAAAVTASAGLDAVLDDDEQFGQPSQPIGTAPEAGEASVVQFHFAR